MPNLNATSVCATMSMSKQAPAFKITQGKQRSNVRPPRAHFQAKPIKNMQGFTLIEVIIGIVVLAIALTLVTSLLVPQAKKGVQPVLQMRAIELANAVMNEGTAHRYDELATKSSWNYFTHALTPCLGEGDKVPGYAGFQVCTEIIKNIGSSEVSGASGNNYLQLTVTITPPMGVPIVFSQIKGDF